MLIYPIITILCEVTGYAIDKNTYKLTRISTNYMMQLVFLVMTLSLLVYISLIQLPSPEFTIMSALLVIFIGGVSFVANYFDYLSLRTNNLELRQPILGVEPLIASGIGQLLFRDERSFILLFAIVLSFMVVYAGYRHDKVSKIQSKGLVYLLIAVGLYAIGPSLSKLALEYLSPEYVAFYRVIIILFLATLFLNATKRDVRHAEKKITRTIITGILYTVSTIASLYSIDTFGVSQTMLLLALTPTLVYLIAHFIFKEKVKRGHLVSSFILILLIGSASFMNL